MSKSEQRLTHRRKLIEISQKSTRLNKNATRIYESFDIFDGLVRIYKTTNSGDVYQMRMYVSDEKRYVRKSLKTRDKEIAINNAKKMFIDYSAKIQNGEKLFSITTEQLRNEYIKYETERQESNQISLGRLTGIKTHTKHYLQFVGKTNRIQNIKNNEFMKYRSFRQNTKKDITMTSVVNELITIRKMYEFAKRKGYINQNYDVDWGEIRIQKHEVRRDGMELKEYRQLTKTSAFWSRKVNSLDINSDEEIYYRKLIHDFILSLGNFGFRTTELRLLKWSDVTIKSNGSVSIQIRAENSKVRKNRVVMGNRGDIFKRIQTYSKFKNAEDFVFSHYRKNQEIEKTLLYRYFKKLKEEVKLKYNDFDDSKDLYDIRHFYITTHLLIGKVDAYSIAHYTGTSLQQIQNHYSHIKDIEVSRKMMRTNVKFGKNDEIILEDV